MSVNNPAQLSFEQPNSQLAAAVFQRKAWPDHSAHVEEEKVLKLRQSNLSMNNFTSDCLCIRNVLEDMLSTLCMQCRDTQCTLSVNTRKSSNGLQLISRYLPAIGAILLACIRNSNTTDQTSFRFFRLTQPGLCCQCHGTGSIRC